MITARMVMITAAATPPGVIVGACEEAVAWLPESVDTGIGVATGPGTAQDMIEDSLVLSKPDNIIEDVKGGPYLGCNKGGIKNIIGDVYSSVV